MSGRGVGRAPLAMALAGALTLFVPAVWAGDAADREDAAHAKGSAHGEGAAQDGSWTTFAHGYAFLVSNHQGGPSGARSFESVNHFMTGAARGWGGGTLSLLGTFTLEPATVRPEGSPLLFQRGETYQGSLLVDRQHPHDLFVQLAAEWRRRLSRNAGMRVYLAPWGEPAVGPTAYPHRLSASMNPSAPLAHHNQDSTHISANVVTLAFESSKVGVEASVFHGGEPDENRWNIDTGPIDSYAGRISVHPGGGFSFQVSAARRESPEALEPGDQTRQTASVEYTRTTRGGFVAALLIAGRNLLPEGVEWGNGLETTWKFGGSNFLYGRVESVDRDRFELIAKRERPGTQEPSRTNVKAATFGYAREIPLLVEAETEIGGGVTLYRFESSLDPVYGEQPVSFQVFLKFGFGRHGDAGQAHPHSH